MRKFFLYCHICDSSKFLHKASASFATSWSRRCKLEREKCKNSSLFETAAFFLGSELSSRDLSEILSFAQDPPRFPVAWTRTPSGPYYMRTHTHTHTHSLSLFFSLFLSKLIVSLSKIPSFYFLIFSALSLNYFPPFGETLDAQSSLGTIFFLHNSTTVVFHTIILNMYMYKYVYHSVYVSNILL